MVYFWVYDILNVLFNILNFCITPERIVSKVTIHSLENDYIKKPCQHTGNIANYHIYAGIFSCQLSDKIKLQKLSIYKLVKKIYRNIVLLWYVLIGGVVYISVIIPIFKITVMCSTHTSHTRPIHFPYVPLPTHFSPFLLRYPLRQTPTKSSISPLFTPSKITTNQPKNHINPLKIKHFIEVNQKNLTYSTKQHLKTTLIPYPNLSKRQ